MDNTHARRTIHNEAQSRRMYRRWATGPMCDSDAARIARDILRNRAQYITQRAQDRRLSAGEKCLQSDYVLELQELLSRVDVIMDAAALLGGVSLPPAYMDGWAEIHTKVRATLQKAGRETT